MLPILLQSKVFLVLALFFHILIIFLSDAFRLKPNSPDGLSLRGLVLFLCKPYNV